MPEGVPAPDSDNSDTPPSSQITAADKAKALRQWEEVNAYSRRAKVWKNAADAHLSADPGSEIDLAEGLQAFRRLEELKRAPDNDLELTMKEYTDRLLAEMINKRARSSEEVAQLLQERVLTNRRLEAYPPASSSTDSSDPTPNDPNLTRRSSFSASKVRVHRSSGEFASPSTRQSRMKVWSSTQVDWITQGKRDNNGR